MSVPYIGQITVFPYSFPPRGWADCTGQLMSIAQNTALFSLLGTTYGGNGTSNFGLPDLQGRIPIGQGQGPGLSDYVMGEISGSESVTVLTQEMPAHTHALNAKAVDGSTNSPTNVILAQPQVGGGHGGGGNVDKGNIYNASPVDTTLSPVSVSMAGGSQPHNNIQPSLVLRYCIALQGEFPQRQ